MKRCPQCGATHPDYITYCTNCGYSFVYITPTYPAPGMAPPTAYPQPQYYPQPINAPFVPHTNTLPGRISIGLSALVLGGFGVHKFMMKQPIQGLLCLFFCWTGIPTVLGVLEGIRYLCLNDADFETVMRESMRPFGQLPPVTLQS